jgi:hypothetical protein
MSEQLNDMDGGIRETMEANVTYLGVLPLGLEGEKQIASHAVTQDEQDELFEQGKQRIVSVDTDKAAGCIDGRCAVCTANTTARTDNPEDRPSVTTTEKVPILPKVPGGTYHFATTMAMLGNWSLVEEAQTYDEAFAIVSDFLDKQGIENAEHTTLTALDNPNATECGAKDKVVLAFGLGVAENEAWKATQQAGPVVSTLAALNGYETGADMIAGDATFKEVQRTFLDRMNNDMFKNYSPVKYRDELRNNNPERLEVLESDKEHPTHSHIEDGVGINEIDGTTLDRDENNGRLFWYDRWFTRKLVGVMAATEAEQQRMLMAGDYATLMITSQLVAKDSMPASLYEVAA